MGKYLFSDNLATFFNYCVNCSSLPPDPSTQEKKVTGCDGQIAGSDIITTVLLVTANMILWGPVKKELEQTKFYKFICCIKSGDAWTAEAATNDETAALAKGGVRTESYKGTTSNSQYIPYSGQSYD